MKKRIDLVLINVVILSLGILPNFSFAGGEEQKEVPPGISQQKDTPGEGLHKGWKQGKHKGWNKEGFGERQAHLKERLEYLKQNDPQRCQQIMQKIRHRQRERLKGLREENPQNFKEIIQRRKARLAKRLENLKTENPTKHEQIMQYKQQLQELKQLKHQDPEKFRDFLKHHPHLCDRLEDKKDRYEDIKDRREEIRDRREDIRDRREEIRDRREDRRDNNPHPGHGRGLPR